MDTLSIDSSRDSRCRSTHWTDGRSLGAPLASAHVLAALTAALLCGCAAQPQRDTTPTLDTKIAKADFQLKSPASSAAVMRRPAQPAPATRRDDAIVHASHTEEDNEPEAPARFPTYGTGPIDVETGTTDHPRYHPPSEYPLAFYGRLEQGGGQCDPQIAMTFANVTNLGLSQGDCERGVLSEEGHTYWMASCALLRAELGRVVFQEALVIEETPSPNCDDRRCFSAMYQRVTRADVAPELAVECTYAGLVFERLESDVGE